MEGPFLMGAALRLFRPRRMTTIYSIGHSNRSLTAFLSLLKSNRIAALADIRQFTRSRANPQFNAEALSLALREHGIDYQPAEGFAERFLGKRNVPKLCRLCLG